MANKTLKKVYLSLDALFDLRQGTLNCISPEFAAEVTSSETYFTREIDQFETKTFGSLSPAIYKKVFEKHGNLILRNSLMTKILTFVHSLFREFFKQAINTPFLSGVELEINTYPFILSAKEERDILECVVTHIGVNYSISLVHLSPAMLSPDVIRGNYVAVIMYDYVEWFNTHGNAVVKVPMRDVGFYLPKLLFGRKFTKAELNEFAKMKTNPFDFFATAMAPLTVVQHLPIALYSVNVPANLPKYSALVKELPSN
jgi:hypothetical protein